MAHKARRRPSWKVEIKDRSGAKVAVPVKVAWEGGSPAVAVSLKPVGSQADGTGERQGA